MPTADTTIELIQKRAEMSKTCFANSLGRVIACLSRHGSDLALVGRASGSPTCFFFRGRTQGLTRKAAFVAISAGVVLVLSRTLASCFDV